MESGLWSLGSEESVVRNSSYLQWTRYVRYISNSWTLALRCSPYDVRLSDCPNAPMTLRILMQKGQSTASILP